MKLQRCLWALLVAAVFASLGSSRANAWDGRVFVGPGFGYYQAPAWGYSYYYYSYVAPLPGYDILPPPFAMMNSNGYGYYSPRIAYARPVEDYGYVPRARASLYPAIPFKNSEPERPAMVRRARYEITVPCPGAIVLFDGVKTKRTGLTRVFVTPPMQADKEYASTITVAWAAPDGTVRTRTQTFTIHAGDTVQHTFGD